MTFTPNSAGIQALAVSPEMSAVVGRIAERGKEIAEDLSQDFRRTGEYASSFETAVEIQRDPVGRHPHERAVGLLRNTSDHAAAVEFGYEGRSGDPGSSAHHVLGRMLDALSRE